MQSKSAVANLGDLEVLVLYDYTPPEKEITHGPMAQPAMSEQARATAVLVWQDKADIDIIEYLHPKVIANLEAQVLEGTQ